MIHHSPEAERGILGCILLSAVECMGVIAKRLAQMPPKSTLFQDLRHGALYDEMLAMQRDGSPVDMVGLVSRLKDRSMIDAVGGIGYIATLPEATPSAANLEYYLDIAIEKWLLREAAEAAHATARKLTMADADVAVIMADGQAALARVERLRSALTGDVPPDTSPHIVIRDVMPAFVDDLQKRSSAPHPGIPTGLRALDRLIGGWMDETLNGICGRPSDGKTCLLLNSVSACLSVDRPCSIFTAESTNLQLARRLCCIRQGVESAHIAKDPRSITELEMEEVLRFVDEMQAMPLHLHFLRRDAARIHMLAEAARRDVEEHGVRIIFVDYLQRIRGYHDRYQSRQVELADVAKGLADLSKEMKVPVVAAIALNRNAVGRGAERDRMPRLSDIRESGDVEYELDIGCLIHHSEKEGTQIIVDKGRDTGVGVAAVEFDCRTLRWLDIKFESPA